MTSSAKPLEPTGVDADATGEAEVEFSKDAPADQEVEFSVRNVSAGAVLTFVIDGTDVATARADRRGRAEVRARRTDAWHYRGALTRSPHSACLIPRMEG